MAFLFKKQLNSAIGAPSMEVLPAAAATYKVGDALVITSGKLAKAGATATPLYISAASKTCAAGEELPVYKINGDQLYETTLAAAGTLTIGAKYTLHTDSAQVTATSSSGVAEVVSVEGATVGSKVVVKF